MTLSLRRSFVSCCLFGLVILVFMAWTAPALALNPIIFPPGSVVTQTLTAQQENQELIDQGRATPQTLPFATGTSVYEVRTSRVGYYVRYYKNDPNEFRNGGVGGWMMAASSVKGMNSYQVRDLYALPKHPDRVLVVMVPAGTMSRTGSAGPIAGWGNGGGQQFVLNGRISADFYKGARSTTDDVYTGSFAAQAGGGNPGAVATYLDNITPAYYTLHEVSILMLSYLPSAPRRQALNQLGPERYDTLSRLELQQSILFSDALSQRRNDLRVNLMGATKGEKVQAVGQPAPFQQKVGGMYLWGRGAGGMGDAKSTGDNTGFDYLTGSFMGGADWLLGPNFILGMGAGVITSRFDWKDSGGDGTLNGLKLGGYGSYFCGSFFLDGTLTAGYNASHAGRSVNFPGMDYNASADPNGYSFSAGLNGGLNFLLDGWTLQPLASFNLMYVNTNSFTESNIDSLSLRVNEFDATSLRSELALRMTKNFVCESGMKIVPEFRLGWAHDFALGDRDITAGLVDQAGDFTVKGYDQDSDAILPGLGLTLVSGSGGQAYFRYDAEIGDALVAHILSAGVRIPFDRY